MKGMYRFILMLLLCAGLLAGCGAGEADDGIYSDKGMWLSLPETAEQEVDVFYLYPTAWGRFDDKEPYICSAEDPAMRQTATDIFTAQATVFENTCNVYAPYYSQVDAAYCLDLLEEERDKVMREGPVFDCLEAFDTYIENFNEGRPFILAGHSQGSNVLLYLLADYMEEHPQVYERMIAAYVIGYSVTEEYLKENPHLKFAEGADDTGVIISYNTEAQEIEGDSPVRLPGAIAINPVNWKRDETPASAEENLGELVQNPNDSAYQRVIPGDKDAVLDVDRGAVICTNVDPGDYPSRFPRGVYHAQDYLFYYFNLRANAKERIAAYLGEDFLTKEFVVETDWEYQADGELFKADVVMPKIAENVINSDKINFDLLRFNDKEALADAADWDWGYEVGRRTWYSVSNQKGICSLNLFQEFSDAQSDKPSLTINCYYYDETAGDVLTQEQYLKKLGYSRSDIMRIFKEHYGDKYQNRTYDLEDLNFYFDEKNKLRFDTSILDAMTVNYADFYLSAGSSLYKLGSDKSLPGMEVLDRKEEYWPEVWAGSHWLTELYDGAEVLFSCNPDTGEKTAYEVKLTRPKSSEQAAILTYRGARVGDSREMILRLYPELDAEEQALRSGGEDVLCFTDDGAFYLNFWFEEDAVVRIEAGMMIN